GVNVQGAAQLDGQHDPPQAVDVSDDSGGFHTEPPLFFWYFYNIITTFTKSVNKRHVTKLLIIQDNTVTKLPKEAWYIKVFICPIAGLFRKFLHAFSCFFAWNWEKGHKNGAKRR